MSHQALGPLDCSACAAAYCKLEYRSVHLHAVCVCILEYGRCVGHGEGRPTGRSLELTGIALHCIAFALLRCCWALLLISAWLPSNRPAGVNDATIILMITLGMYQASCNIVRVYNYNTDSMSAQVGASSSSLMLCCGRTTQCQHR